MPTLEACVSNDPRLRALVDFYEQLTPGHLARVGEVYARDVRFKDPFNEVQGLDALAKVFEHMFKQQPDAKFKVTHAAVRGQDALLVWTFHCTTASKSLGQLTLRGCTHVHFDASGKVDVHRDYWDAAEELYEKLPGLGVLMRWLKKRLRAS
jgi:steroid Delta-isomerase